MCMQELDARIMRFVDNNFRYHILNYSFERCWGSARDFRVFATPNDATKNNPRILLCCHDT